MPCETGIPTFRSCHLLRKRKETLWGILCLQNLKSEIGDMPVLALAPLSVVPEYQRKGIGSALIKEGHRVSVCLGFSYSVVLGSENYYSRYGYVPADIFGIQAPFDVPREKFMAYKLKKDAPEVCGTIRYAREFGIT